MSTRYTSLVLPILLCASPTTALANVLFTRLGLDPNGFIKTVKSASMEAKTTSRKGANGILVITKVTGARDLSGNPANVTLSARVGLGGDKCFAEIPFPVTITNGSANVTVTGTDIGLSEDNSFPGRMLPLCAVPVVVTPDFKNTIFEFDLDNPSPGLNLKADFILAAGAPGNPITSWGKARVVVQNVKGAVLATTSIAGAKEGTMPSMLTIIPAIPTGSTCTLTPYILSAILLDNGRGSSTTPNLLDEGTTGDCIGFDLENEMLQRLTDGFGVVQGIDKD